MQCNQDLSLLEALKKPLDDGIINICFLDLILQLLLCIYLFIFGSLRLRRIRSQKNQKRNIESQPFTTIFIAKIGASFTIALLPLLKTLIHLANDDFLPISSILSSFYIPLGWIMSSFILLKEHEESLQSSWTLKMWWIASFLLSSFTFQTNLQLSKKYGYGVDFVASLFNFVLQISITTSGLFFNSPTSVTAKYEELKDLNRSSSNGSKKIKETHEREVRLRNLCSQ